MLRAVWQEPTNYCKSPESKSRGGSGLILFNRNMHMGTQWAFSSMLWAFCRGRLLQQIHWWSHFFRWPWMFVSFFVHYRLPNLTIFSCKFNNWDLTHILFQRWKDAIEGFKNASTSADPTHNVPFLRLQNLNQRTDWSCTKHFLINVYINNKCHPNKNGFHWHTRRVCVSCDDCPEVQELCH